MVNSVSTRVGGRYDIKTRPSSRKSFPTAHDGQLAYKKDNLSTWRGDWRPFLDRLDRTPTPWAVNNTTFFDLLERINYDQSYYISCLQHYYCLAANQSGYDIQFKPSIIFRNHFYFCFFFCFYRTKPYQRVVIRYRIAEDCWSLSRSKLKLVWVLWNCLIRFREFENWFLWFTVRVRKWFWS